MRKLFRDLLLKQIEKNKDVYLLLGGVGYGLYKPDNKRIINCEASEQAMVDIAVGLALSGKKVFVYCITPHLFRAFEGIRIYLSHYKIPVNLIGVGRDRDYTTLGFTHWGEGDEQIIKLLKIKQYRPKNKTEVRKHFKEIIKSNKPTYINLPR